MATEMLHLDLYSGCGGAALAALLLGWRTIAYVEINKYNQRVISQRIRDGYLPKAPIFTDIRSFTNEGYATAYQGLVDVLTAGFPCQPFSYAGKRDWKTSPKNLWLETAEVIQHVTPRRILLENVSGIRPYLPVVIRDLRRLGYTVERPLTLAAAAVGAGHIRKRVWVYAYLVAAGQANDKARATPETQADKWRASCLDDAKIPPNTGKVRELQSQGGEQNERRWPSYNRWWAAEPDLVRVVYGVSHGMDRIGALGEAWVPIVAAYAWRLLVEEA